MLDLLATLAFYGSLAEIALTVVLIGWFVGEAVDAFGRWLDYEAGIRERRRR